MKVKGVAHIAINTSDYEKSMVFYRDIVGFEYINRVQFDGYSITYLQIPCGALMEIFEYGKRDDTASGDNALTGYRHLAFTVEDVDEVEKKMNEHNIPVRLRPTDMPELGVRGMLVVDPNGIEVEFCKPL